jgi:hypothetical protein
MSRTIRHFTRSVPVDPNAKPAADWWNHLHTWETEPYHVRVHGTGIQRDLMNYPRGVGNEDFSFAHPVTAKRFADDYIAANPDAPATLKLSIYRNRYCVAKWIRHRGWFDLRGLLDSATDSEGRDSQTAVRIGQPSGVVATRTGVVSAAAEPVGVIQPKWRKSFVIRVARSSAVVEHVRTLHDRQCQLCGVRLMTANGPYAEGAHIRPLGGEHRGRDTPDNVLCLCPNCHVRFDTGALVIRDDLGIWDQVRRRVLGTLRCDPRHKLDPDALAYHRQFHALPTDPK